MPQQHDHTLAPMVRKLQQWRDLGENDERAILALPFTKRKLSAGQHIVWDGDRPQYTTLLDISGFAYRHKVAGNGGRQIMSIHMKGDILDLQKFAARNRRSNVQMLTSGEVALIPVAAIQDIAFDYPSVGRAMWYETLVDGSIFREWLLNVGRRDARTRISHLLCEFAMRLEIADLGNQTEYELPITQEQLADATSLDAGSRQPHVDGTEADGLIKRDKRVISISDWKKLAKVADFQPRYLHPDSRLPAAA